MGMFHEEYFTTMILGVLENGAFFLAKSWPLQCNTEHDGN